jgi:hypothetical protein
MTTRNLARSGLPERSVLIAFLLFIVVGGGASVAIRVTYAEMAPFWAAASRFALGALALWAVVFFKRIPLPKGRALTGTAPLHLIEESESWTVLPQAWRRNQTESGGFMASELGFEPGAACGRFRRGSCAQQKAIL